MYRRNVPSVSRRRTVRTFHRSNVIQNWKTDALQILFDAAYFLLAVMVEGDESRPAKDG